MLLAGVQSCGARAENAWQRTAGRIASRAVSERCILFSEKQRLTFVLSVRTQGMSGTEVGGAEAVPGCERRKGPLRAGIRGEDADLQAVPFM